ncbi:uncharacterized protein DUF4003 [Ureibacillus xyleni]|uniref:Uncharacterized protein DUF4003 n=1 Tax=Ureibacillus xyleni TaxID=614648 RepID=A0A285SLP8_9BACL|nr:DUF4003 family protein [Ureibacillus xyleni]SOC08925.1 uncharacterized protein DUF4003 [Ureibacillus xyleni]
MNNEQFIEAFQQNYNRVFNYMGGGDIKLYISLACKYTLAMKQFSGVLLQKVCEQLAEEGNGSFSISDYSTANYRLAAHIFLEGNLNKNVSDIMINDQFLKEARFKKSPFRGIGALFLQEDKQQHAARAKQLFVEMNRNQRILTSNGDIPYVVFLTSNKDNNPLEQSQTIFEYYTSLRKQQFSMGNHLQALTQIMTMYSSDYNEMLLQYIVQLKTELEKRGIRVKKIHYPFIGVLALAATNASKLDDILNLHNQLLKLKVFKTAKNYALIVAIQKIIQDTIEVQEVIELSPISNLTQLVDLLDIAEILIEFSRLLPGGISEVVDFFN